MAYVLTHAEVRYAVVENQEQADKVLSIAATSARSARSSTMIRAACRSTIRVAVSIESVQDAGRTALEADPAVRKAWLDGIAVGKGSDVSVVLYTSGTTGRPKA